MSSFQENRNFIFILLFGALFLILGLEVSPLIDWDENIYAEASRQMVERSNYLNVYVNDYPFAEKPPFFFWEQSLSYHLFGINEFGARFPSAFAGILMIVFCYFAGRKIASKELGEIWALVYLTCLIPAIFAKSAVIDHTFNLFIGFSSLLLYAYDVQHQKSLENKLEHFSFWEKPWTVLTIASCCLGLGVLTKGPLGGVVPLVGFTGYKIWFCRKGVPWLHFLFCGVVSLSIAVAWYLLNWAVYGSEFILGFIQFQFMLLSKTAEGHTGPFFYHFLAVFLGLFPWSFFLFSFRKFSILQENSHYRPLLILGSFWTFFVLILMSIVSTKLPHYSSPVYFPLSLFIAVSLHHYLKTKTPIPRWILLGYLILGGVFGLTFLFFPQLAEYAMAQRGDVLNFDWPTASFMTGTGLLVGVGTGFFFFWKNKIMKAVWMTALGAFLFSQGLWRYQVPAFLEYDQTPMVNLVLETQKKEGRLLLYRRVSFAALYYGKQPIEMLHTYKFPGDPTALDTPQDEDLYVITEKVNIKQLIKEHPLVQHVKDAGQVSLFILPKKQ